MTTVQRVLDEAVRARTTPGAAAAVVRGDGSTAMWVAGARDYASETPTAVTVDTVYDLASLTKLLSTTVLVADAVARQELRLHECPWPSWPGVSVEHVLRHTAGLPAWLPLHLDAARGGVVGLPASAARVQTAVTAVVPSDPPGAVTRYSDLGMIALGALLEERGGAALDRLFEQRARPLLCAPGLRFVRLAELGFHPALPDIAPTERCPWRRRVVHGQVHDENAFALGGVAGHAGLFGSVRDVAHAGTALLRILRAPQSPTERSLAAFAAGDGPRGIGFDRATPDGTTGGVLSPRAVGHLAFTGCSLFIDPDGVGAAFVLLTNRIHDNRDATTAGIRALRVAFHRAAVATTAPTA